MPDYEVVDVSTGTEITSPTANDMMVAFNSSTSALEKIGFDVLVNAVMNNANVGTAIVGNTDLNDLTTPGVYKSGDSSRTATLVNCPVSGAGFVLCVYQHSGNGKIQVLYRGTNASVYTRSRTSAGWSEWTRLARADELSGKQSMGLGYSIEEGTDLNTILTPSTYRCSTNATAATLVNCPTRIAFILDVRIGATSAYVIQTITTHTGSFTYKRRVTVANGTATDWIEYAGTAVS